MSTACQQLEVFSRVLRTSLATILDGGEENLEKNLPEFAVSSLCVSEGGRASGSCVFKHEMLLPWRECPGQKASCGMIACMQSGWGFGSLVDICHCRSYGAPTLSPCNVPEDGMSRGAHVPVCPGHDVRAGPGRARGLRRTQDRTGGAALRPGEVRDGVCAGPGPD